MQDQRAWEDGGVDEGGEARRAGEEILLGQTKLRFVPFCGKNFDWYQK